MSTRSAGPGVPTAPGPATTAPEFPPTSSSPTGPLSTSWTRPSGATGSKTALEFFGARTSYRELGAAISKAAAGLKKLGVRAGDRVALVLPNCPQHIIAFHAALRLGAVVVEHNPLYTDRELRHQFEDHGATVAMVWDKAVDKVRQLPADVGLQSIVSVETDSGDAAAATAGAAAPGARRPRGPGRLGRRQAHAPARRRRRRTGQCWPWKELLGRRRAEEEASAPGRRMTWPSSSTPAAPRASPKAPC